MGSACGEAVVAVVEDVEAERVVVVGRIEEAAVARIGVVAVVAALAVEAQVVGR